MADANVNDVVEDIVRILLEEDGIDLFRSNKRIVAKLLEVLLDRWV